MVRQLLEKVKRIIRKIIIGDDISTYFFSQAGEDATLRGLFNENLRNKQKGFYVDIGAHHPSHHSNTLLFYREGWNGINVDPRPEFLSVFNKQRKRDVNLNFGISETSGTMNLYYYGKDSTINSFSPVKGYSHERVIEIEVKTLEELFDEYVPKATKIDFMTIDVEGHEMQVLKSNNWEKYKPKIIAIEQDSYLFSEVLNHPSTIFLMSHDYEPVAKNIVRPGISTVFFNHTSELLNK